MPPACPVDPVPSLVPAALLASGPLLRGLLTHGLSLPEGELACYLTATKLDDAIELHQFQL